MEKKIGVAIMGAVVVAVLAVNVFSFFSRSTGAAISGNAIGDGGLSGINLSLIAFVGQWILLLVLVMFAYMRFLKHRKEEEEKIAHFVIPKLNSVAETDIDSFYSLLKEKKELSTGTIAQAFKITKDRALDWAKVLEEHNLATIEYPAFADPEVRIFGLEEEEKKAKEEKKEKEEAEKKKKETAKELAKQKGSQDSSTKNVVQVTPPKQIGTNTAQVIPESSSTPNTRIVKT